MLALSGCAGSEKPAPLVSPGVALQTSNYVGTPLSGPLVTDAASIQNADAIGVAVTFVALENMPSAFDSLDSQVRMIVAMREGTPVIPSGILPRRVRFTSHDHAGAFLDDLKTGKYGRSAAIASQSGVLLHGATATFSISDRGNSAEAIPGQSTRRRIELELSRPNGAAGAGGAIGGVGAAGGGGAGQPKALNAALLVEDFVNASNPLEDSNGASSGNSAASSAPRPGVRGFSPAPRPPPPVPPVFVSELAMFDRPGGSDAFALIVPIEFTGAASAAVVAVVEISPASADAAFQKAVAHAVEELKGSSATAAMHPDLVPVDPPDWPGLASGMESLFWAGRQRAGLAFLAGQTNAGITEDVALGANDSVVSRLADAVRKAAAANPAARDRKSLGWLLEKTTLQMLIQIRAGGKLPDELAAILSLRAGEAGRQQSTLEEVLGGATGQQDLENRFAAENYIFLEDSSPAARVRAFDWLRSRQLSPAGYDPLATTKQRRDALEKARQAAAQIPPAQ